MTGNDQRRALTERQIECARLVADGLTSKEAARVIGISFRTFEQHINAAREKTGSRTVSGLVAKLIREGVMK